MRRHQGVRTNAATVLCLTIALACSVAACTGGGSGPSPTSAAATSSTATGVSPSRTSGTTLAALPVGSSERALSHGDQIRMYRTYRPARLLDPAPLVVMLHGGLGSARLAQAAYGWDAIADREGFLVLYPDSLDGAWNVGGGCCGSAPERGVDDVAFVAAAIADLERTVPTDPTRRYAAGMSNGGMLAYRLACDTTLFAAIGPVAATQLGDCPNPAPISVMHVHGSADTTVPLDGRGDVGLASFAGPPIPSLIQTWRNIDRCGGTIERVEGRVTTSTAQCASGRAVALVLVDGGGHAWPGVAHRGPLDASPAPTVRAGVTGTTATPSPATPPPAPGAGTPTGAGSAGPSATPTPGATPTLDYDTTANLWAFFAPRSR